MKRIKIVALANDFTGKSSFEPLFLELEHYEEKQIPKEQDIFTAHSFETLEQAAKDFVNSLWTAVNSFIKMSMWAVIVIAEAIKWLWNKTFKKQ
jgi:hypothetical protein